MSEDVHYRAEGDVTGLGAALELVPMLVVGTGQESVMSAYESGIIPV
jgi:hypothetical protein